MSNPPPEGKLAVQSLVQFELIDKVDELIQRLSEHKEPYNPTESQTMQVEAATGILARIIIELHD